MRAGWTASGACTNGSTAHQRDVTRRASGGAVTTSTTSAECDVMVVVAFFGISALLFTASAALAAIEMQQPALARAVPIAAGVVVVIAGALQFSAWKTRHLACCRNTHGRSVTPPAGATTAWRHGVRLGLLCANCCINLMAILLVTGVMDLRAMALVTAAITIERLAPDGERVARAIGTVVVGAGSFLIARAAGLG